MISRVVGNIRRLLYEIYKFLSVSHNPILFRLKYFLPISIKAMWFFKKKKCWEKFNGNSKKYILHIIPENTSVPSLNYLGSSKDIKTRTDFFKRNNISFISLKTIRGDRMLKAILKVVFLKLIKKEKIQIHTIYLDVPGSYGLTIKYLKKYYPDLKIIFRSHNAEGFHRFEWKMQYYTGLKCYISDCLTLRHADEIHSISEYDIVNYWNKLFFSSHDVRMRKIKYVPYYLTDQLLSEIKPREDNASNQKYLIYGSSYIQNQRLDQEIMYLSGFVGKFPKDIKISYTGPIIKHLKTKERMHNIGDLESPLPVLHSYSALFVLDSSGWGFKTKILEAIMAGCYVIMRPEIALRVPLALHPYIIYCEKDINIYQIEYEIKNRTWFDPTYINNLLKNQADRILMTLNET